MLTGVEIPRDPDTGEPLESQQLKAAMSRLWAFEPADARVTELAAADLGNYVRAIDRYVQDLAAATRTPPHFLMAGNATTNLSADAIAALDLLHAAKCEELQRSWSRPIREAVGLALGADATVAPVWRPVARYSPSQVADAAVKEKACLVDRRLLWRKLGYTPQEVDAMDERVASLPASVPIKGASEGG